MNNDAIKQGAYYLLRGGTLLSEPCKKCGNLQIRFKGNIICMTCKNDIEPNSMKTEAQLTTIPSEKKRQNIENIKYDSDSEPQMSESTPDIQTLLKEIEIGVVRNLSFASTKLSTTADLIAYQNIGNIVEQSLRIIKLIKEIRKT